MNTGKYSLMCAFASCSGQSPITSLYQELRGYEGTQLGLFRLNTTKQEEDGIKMMMNSYITGKYFPSAAEEKIGVGGRYSLNWWGGESCSSAVRNVLNSALGTNIKGSFPKGVFLDALSQLDSRLLPGKEIITPSEKSKIDPNLLIKILSDWNSP